MPPSTSPSFSILKAKIGFLVCSLVAGACAAPAPAASSPREHLSLDAGWKFHLGDDWPGALRLDKAGISSGPAMETFGDLAWRTVDLPHDWAVEVPFDRGADLGHGYKQIGPGFEKTSIGWYRRTFTLPAEDAGKRIWLTFDGVFRDATVWVNGWLVSRHESGYYPFREDITDIVKFGARNTIAVRVDAAKFEGWWYEGAGIYRHVWLDKTAPVAIAPDGIFVRTEFAGNVPKGEPDLKVDAEVLNSQSKAVDATVRCEVFSPDGRSVATFSGSENVDAGATATVKLQSKVPSPVLWSPESPKLYKLVTTLSVGDKIVDRKETAFGIRTVGFDPATGFLLNGRHYPIYGVCNHQDHAGVGVAIPDALHDFRIRKLKEFGCNAIRTSHNPPTPELLEACDHLGMLVLDENRLLGSDSANLAKLEDMIRRDRNHPGIFLWGIANEEGAVQSSPGAARIALTMQNAVKRLDPTRLATYAAAEEDSFAGINGVIDVRGWNYHPFPCTDTYHAKHPDQPNIGTEQGSTVATRGIYEEDPARGHVAAYDHAPSQWVQDAETWWRWYAERPWLSGGFVWTGFDYRGEPTPYGWPDINSHFGIYDMCGFPKDNFYYYKAWWTRDVVLHLLPHWNWPGKEGREIRVDVLSNCKAVELFLNGVSLGKKTMKPNSKLTWMVKYAPGTLSAKGLDASGKVMAETKVETTGEATQLRLTPDRATIHADGEDVSVFTVAALDAKGRVVPTAQNKIDFTLEGEGRIIGVGNGDPSCHEPDTFISTAPVRSMTLDEWRWKLVPAPGDAASLPECAKDFDASAWAAVQTKSDEMAHTIAAENACAVYRAHLALPAGELKGARVQIRFTGADDEAWYFVNGQRVGETHDFAAQAVFDITKSLHAGDNVIAVLVKNGGYDGGLKPGISVDLIGQPSAPQWSRSLFNGLAQVIVQSTRKAGEFKLTATAEGLEPAATTVITQPFNPRPSVP